MKRILLTMLFTIGMVYSYSQNSDTTKAITNSAENLLMQNSKLTIGGYGEVHYNQDIDGEVNNTGTLDVHRMVMLFGYNFNEKTKFITELEFEHVNEVYVEQAFLQHKINSYINLRAGLLLIPMGIINEYHEPTTFNGVERPSVDKYLAPTTWREIGFGFAGNILPASLKYQAYVMTGLNGYDGESQISGSGFRSGRQKGSKSYMSSPILTGKLTYYGIKGLNLGASTYFGSTQSMLFDNLNNSSDSATARADSSVMDIVMLGIDARYNIAGFELRGQAYYTTLDNTSQYNYFTAIDGTPNNVASEMYGYYLEAGYNVFRLISDTKSKLVPFVRYERYDTQHRMENGFIQNDATDIEIITSGISWTPTRGAIIKVDYQLIRNMGQTTFEQTFNAGVGVMF